ncbi:MAG: hypothetical protein H6624_03295 [Bdellovibrionaceae bacterium]|nr:hypothetical protein [Bdellovibrionales bacterium]MCB9083340.1 hypothetical protein [Pseudobdellovibrionaceae bacterium]
MTSRPLKIFLLLFGLGLSLPVSAGLPQQSCREAWSRLIPKNQHKYNYLLDEQAPGEEDASYNGAQYPFPADEKRTEKGNEGYSSWLKRTNRQNCYKDWTVLVYMAADNDLSPYALADLYEMEADFVSGNYAASTLKTDLIVEVDTADKEGARRFHMFQAPREYRTDIGMPVIRSWQAKEVRSPLVAIVPEDRADHTERLREFLNWAVSQYPSKHYMVMIWGHGQGWTAVEPKLPAQSPNDDLWNPFLKGLELKQPGGPVAEPRPGGLVPLGPMGSQTPDLELVRGFQGKYGGLAFDDSSGSYLDIPSLRQVLQDVVDGPLEGKPFDLYVSDACLMQQLEVAYEMEGVARFVVGSAQIQNFFGLPYRRLMYELNRGSFAGFRKQIFGKVRELVAKAKLSPICQRDGMAGEACQRLIDSFEVDEALLLGYAIPEIVRASFSSGGFQWRMDQKGKDTLTMASVSTAEMRNYLLPELRHLGRDLLALIDEEPERALEIQYVIGKTPSFAGGMKDVGLWAHLMQRMIKQEEMRHGFNTPQAKRVLKRLIEVDQALNYSVLNRAMGESYTFKDRSRASFVGTSVWLPASTEDYDARVTDFQKSRFFSWPIKGSDAQHWQNLLRKVYHPFDP